MNTEEFKKIVRAIVQEEIKKSLPNLVPKIVAEALSVNTPKTNEINNFFDDLKAEIEGNRVKPATRPAAQKKFSSNPLLNQVLNETEGGVPPDASYGAQLQRPNFKKATYALNAQQAPSALNEETKAQAQIGAFKDYRKLMKAIDTKKKQGTFGGGSVSGLSIEGGVPNDFSTID